MPFITINFYEAENSAEVIGKLDEVSRRLEQLVAQGENIMADLVTLKEVLASVHTGLDNIHADILRLLEKTEGALTAAEVAELHADLEALDARVTGIADVVPEPEDIPENGGEEPAP